MIRLYWNQVTHLNFCNAEIFHNLSILTNAKTMKSRILKLIRIWLTVYMILNVAKIIDCILIWRKILFTPVPFALKKIIVLIQRINFVQQGVKHQFCHLCYGKSNCILGRILFSSSNCYTDIFLNDNPTTIIIGDLWDNELDTLWLSWGNCG